MSVSKENQLRKEVVPFENSNTKSSLRQLFNTLPPFILLWYAAYLSLSVSYALTLVIVIIASGFLVRTFIIFHDCCHQSFFKKRWANDLLGTITGILTFVPYQQWKNSHAIHHATSSNLDKRGVGDMWILTVEEYVNSPLWRRMAYRIYRNPFMMFGLGPFYTFLIAFRFNTKGARKKERINTWITNVSIVVLHSFLCWAVGWQSFLLVHVPIFWLSGALGIWLFYVQHQFEDTYFENEEEWNYVKAAVEGSSFYRLPKVLQWITGNIGFHHVHHLNPRVPNYNLEKAHNAVPPLRRVTTVTIASSVKGLRYRLWDVENKQFVSFKEIRPLLNKRENMIHPLEHHRPIQENKV